VAPGGDQWRIDGVQSGVMSAVYERPRYVQGGFMNHVVAGRPGELANADFSDDTVVGGYEYRAPTGWTTRHRRRTGTVLVKHGNDAWGLANTMKFSENLLALQGRGAFVEQAVANLEPEQQYTVTFLSASRRGFGDDEMLTVSADGKELLTVHPWDTSSAQDGVNKYSVVFTAAKATATIRFENTSPAGDKTVFVTRVEIGATCAMPKGPADWDAAYINPAHARDSGAVQPPQPTMEGWGMFYEVDCQCWGAPRDYYHLGFLNRYEAVHMTYGSLRDQALALKIALGNNGRHPCAVKSTGLGWCAGTFGLHYDDWQGMRNAKESCGAPESDPFYSR